MAICGGRRRDANDRFDSEAMETPPTTTTRQSTRRHNTSCGCMNFLVELISANFVWRTEEWIKVTQPYFYAPNPLTAP